MAGTIHEKFSKKIFQRTGVKEYILVRNDGQILTHKFSAGPPKAVASMIALGGIDCSQIRASMGFSHFNHFKLTLSDNTHLLVFPLQTFFLGIVIPVDRYGRAFVDRINRFVRELSTRSAD